MCGGLVVEVLLILVFVVVLCFKDLGINGDDFDLGVEFIFLFDMEIFFGIGCLVKVRLDGEMGDCFGGLYGEGEDGRWILDMIFVIGGEVDLLYMFVSWVWVKEWLDWERKDEVWLIDEDVWDVGMVGWVEDVGMGVLGRGCGGVLWSKEVDGDVDVKGWIEWFERWWVVMIFLGLGDGGVWIVY